VTRADFTYPKPIADKVGILFLGGRNNPVNLDSHPPIGLWISFTYQIVKAAGHRGPWKVKTLGYQYTLLDQQNREIVSYQWHSGHPVAHIHVSGPYRYVHFETGRIYLEQVLRTAIKEFNVRAKHLDWENILAQRQRNLERHGSWPPR
jgi:hypothetical protein